MNINCVVACRDSNGEPDLYALRTSMIMVIIMRERKKQSRKMNMKHLILYSMNGTERLDLCLK